MTSLSLLIMDQPPRGGGAKKLWGGENFSLSQKYFLRAIFFRFFARGKEMNLVEEVWKKD